METEVGNRLEKQLAKRILETVIYLVVSLILFLVGLKFEDINYSLFFYMMAAFFFLAIFRPRVLP